MRAHFFRRLVRDKKGQGLVEYGLLIAGVALISAAAVSVFGHKTDHLISAVAAVLPGAHTDDNNTIFAGQLIETAPKGVSGSITLDVDTIATTAKGTDRLGINVLGDTQGTNRGFDGLIAESK